MIKSSEIAGSGLLKTLGFWWKHQAKKPVFRNVPSDLIWCTPIDASPIKYLIGSKKKKVIFLMAVSIRPYHPPSRLMAVRTFSTSRKKSPKSYLFLIVTPLRIPGPQNWSLVMAQPPPPHLRSPELIPGIAVDQQILWKYIYIIKLSLINHPIVLFLEKNPFAFASPLPPPQPVFFCFP